MARPVDEARRTELLDRVVEHLAGHGLAGLSLRPLAADLGVSVSTLTHHFGSRDDLIVAALRRSAQVQKTVEARWLRDDPDMTTADLLRRWWKWLVASPRNLALVRLEIEAAALEATLSGLPRDLRGEQIGFWRRGLEDRLVSEGLDRASAVLRASLLKAGFTGLVVDLLATGERQRLTRTLDEILRLVAEPET
jgi:AcrR family transcriptional regulator